VWSRQPRFFGCPPPKRTPSCGSPASPRRRSSRSSEHEAGDLVGRGASGACGTSAATPSRRSLAHGEMNIHKRLVGDKPPQQLDGPRETTTSPLQGRSDARATTRQLHFSRCCDVPGGSFISADTAAGAANAPPKRQVPRKWMTAGIIRTAGIDATAAQN
jgi:hypothetical protein